MTIRFLSALPLRDLVPRFFALLCIWILSSQPAVIAQQNSIQLQDQSQNLPFVHTDGAYGQFFLIESMSAGLAMLDYDNDGDLDVYMLNGARIELPDNTERSRGSSTARQKDAPPMNRLFRNDGDFQFTDVTQQAGVGDPGMSLGVACADYDNDGWCDIYVNNCGPNSFYHNNGDGTYSLRTGWAGVGNGDLAGGGVCFFDKDLDGDLDLYVGNYIQLELKNHEVHYHKGLPAYPSPMSFQPEVDHLFENQGDGTFRDVSALAGIQNVAGRSMGLTSFDYDRDGDVDIFVANDTQENFLFENDGTGVFEEVALLAGVAVDFNGKPQASMGVEVCDPNRDGLLDLFVTSFSEEFTTLYTNEDGFFSDSTLQMGASAATFPHVTWGIVGEDFNNDGSIEFLIGAGDLDQQKQARGGAAKSTGFAVPNILLTTNPKANSQSGFKHLSNNWGSSSEVARSTRGLLAGDLNGDGRIDAVALNARGPATLMANECASRNFVTIQLIGTKSNRSALGARIQVVQGEHVQFAELRSGHSYQSDFAGPVHFGLPNAEPVLIQVIWPGGATTQTKAKVGQMLSLHEE